jgi:hypothetical protein
MVITLFDHVAVTPAGRPDGVSIPVAPVVVIVIAVKTVLRQSVGFEEGALAVLRGVIVMGNVVELAQSPVVGVNVYVVVVVLLIAGVQVPVIGGTLVDDVGKAGIVAPLQ